MRSAQLVILTSQNEPSQKKIDKIKSALYFFSRGVNPSLNTIKCLKSTEGRTGSTEGCTGKRFSFSDLIGKFKKKKGKGAFFKAIHVNISNLFE
jgi:hypothetical protein